MNCSLTFVSGGRVLLAVLAAALMVAAIACDDPVPEPTASSTDEELPTSSRRLGFIHLAPQNPVIGVGGQQQFTVRVLDEFEEPLDGAEVSFSSSRRPPAGAVSNQGLFTAGTRARTHTDAVTVEVTYGSAMLKASTDVTILPGPLDHVSVKPPVISIEAGEHQRFTAVGRDEFGNPIPGLEYRFFSDPDVGTVELVGKLTATTTSGKYSVNVAAVDTRTSREVSGHAVVNVTAGPVESFAIEPRAQSIETGTEMHFTASGIDRYGNILRDLKVTWQVEEQAGQIDSTGVYTAGGNHGAFGIAATISSRGSKDPLSASTSVTVFASEAVMISAGNGHTCALTVTGAVKCWGSNSRSQLGISSHNSTLDQNTPVIAHGVSGLAEAVTAGFEHTCILDNSGTVSCWGDLGSTGSLTRTPGAICNHGDGCRKEALPVDNLSSNIVAVAAGGRHSCAVTTLRDLLCWGSGEHGELGNGTDVSSIGAVDVIGFGIGVAEVSVGVRHTCAKTTIGGVKCWGLNYFGELGNGKDLGPRGRYLTEEYHEYRAVDVMGLSEGVSAIAVGGDHTCALTTAGKVKCWGQNRYGQLGNGDTTDRNAPVDVAGLNSQVAAIAAGRNHTCALSNEGKVKCWGLNNSGQLGDGTTNQSATPVEVMVGETRFVALSGGGNHTCGITDMGGVKCWGGNGAGNLGDGTYEDRAVPVDVSGFVSR